MILEHYRTSGRGFSIALIDRLVMVAASREHTPVPEYLEFVDKLIEIFTAREIVVQLLYSPLRGPSTSERRLLVERDIGNVLGQARRMAVLTDSALVRGAVTAQAWMLRAISSRGTQTSAYKPQHYRKALRDLLLTAPFDLAEAETMLRLVAEEVGLPLIDEAA
jgi:hypothetical protein